MDNVYLIEEPDFVKCFFVKCTVTLSFHFEEKPVETVRVFERLFVTFCFNSFTIHSVLTEKLLVFLDIRELWLYSDKLSPVKKGNYFDMRLIPKSDSKTTVCFTVDRRSEICTYQAQKSPVKIVTLLQLRLG